MKARSALVALFTLAAVSAPVAAHADDYGDTVCPTASPAAGSADVEGSIGGVSAGDADCDVAGVNEDLDDSTGADDAASDAEDGALPDTGGSDVSLIAVGGGLVLVGGAAVVAARRRRA